MFASTLCISRFKGIGSRARSSACVAALLRCSADPSVQKDTECHHIVVEDWATMPQSRGCLFVSIPSLLDDSLAPEGFHTFHAFAPEYMSEYAGLTGAAYIAKKEEHADEIIDRLEAAVFPGLRAAIVFREVLSSTLLACAGCFPQCMSHRDFHRDAP